MANSRICDDIYYTATVSTAGIYYDIEVKVKSAISSGDYITVYTGKVYALTKNIKVKVNSIIVPYFDYKENYTIDVTVNLSYNGQVLDTKIFAVDNNWSYDNKLGDATIYTGRYIPYTFYDFIPEMEIEVNTGTKQYYTYEEFEDIPGMLNGYVDLQADFTADELKCGSTVVYNDNFGTHTFTYKDTDYQIIYRDSKGCLRQLSIYGNVIKKDNIDQKSYIGTNGTTIWKDEITLSWTVHTGIINSNTAKYIPELYKNIDTKFITPEGIYNVIITDTEAKYLNYTVNGKQPIEYTFNIELKKKENIYIS